MKNKEPYIIVSDGGSHWYLIPEKDKTKFNVWASDMEDGNQSSYDFHSFMIGGGPQLVKIYEWELE